MDEKEIVSLFILLSIVAFCIATVLVTLFIIFQQRKNKLLLQQKEAEKRFEEEINTSQIEIKEETFRNISWELHDNIGQLITLAKVQIQNDDTKENVSETLSKALVALRSLSKQTNPEVLKKIHFTASLQNEIDRFNRLNYIKAHLKIKGDEVVLDQKVEVVLFRILQEFFSNTIKHSKATTLDLLLYYQEECLCIITKDNGVGFNQLKKNEVKGIGLINIEKRAELIGATAKFYSRKNKGTKLEIYYNY